jgi:hypothetical protein
MPKNKTRLIKLKGYGSSFCVWTTGCSKSNMWVKQHHEKDVQSATGATNGTRCSFRSWQSLSWSRNAVLLWNLALSEFSPVQIFTICFCEIHFNNILTYIYLSLLLFYIQNFPSKFFMSILFPPCLLHIPLVLPFIIQFNCITREVQSVKFLITKFSSVLCFINLNFLASYPMDSGDKAARAWSWPLTSI